MIVNRTAPKTAPLKTKVKDFRNTKGSSVKKTRAVMRKPTGDMIPRRVRNNPSAIERRVANMARPLFHAGKRNVTRSMLSPHSLVAGRRLPSFGIRICIDRIPFFLAYVGVPAAVPSSILSRGVSISGAGLPVTPVPFPLPSGPIRENRCILAKKPEKTLSKNDSTRGLSPLRSGSVSKLPVAPRMT